jgi:hypothetical protein
MAGGPGAAVPPDPAGRGAARVLAARVAVQETALAAAAGHPSVAASAVASIGAPLGLGVVAPVFVQCGACSIGNMYTPLLLVDARHHVVSPRYFDTVRIPVVAGRAFRPEDRAGAPPVALVNESLARTSFQGGRAVGRLLQVGAPGSPWHEVVGVVADGRPQGVGAGGLPRPAVYLSSYQHPPVLLTLLARLAGDAPPEAEALALAETLAEGVAASVAEAGVLPGLAGGLAVIGGPATLAGDLTRSREPVAWLARLLTALAAGAVLLAAGSLYAVIAYGVRRRTREIGVRLAVGAPPRRITAMVVRETLSQTLLGTAVGLVVASAVAGYFSGLVVGVRPFDPALYGAVTPLLAAVGLAAALLPARRAAAVDPVPALAAE